MLSPDHGQPIALSAPLPEDMDRIGRRLAAYLRPGDTLALAGPLGAGKSHLARAIIRTLLGDDTAEVPSPSYTLVNVYEAAGVEVWHADLYRIADPEELTEIGLEDATGTCLVIVEWPERWATLPDRRLDIDIEPTRDGTRNLTLHARGGGWEPLCRALDEALA